MKAVIMSIVLAAGVFGTTVMTSCNGGKKEVYECPMKCEGKTFDKPGKCPVCGMDLEKVEPKAAG
jgi:P-type Cu+ transporter